MLNNKEIYSTNLPNRAVAVYIYLRDRADKNGLCFPAISTIAAVSLRMAKVSYGLPSRFGMYQPKEPKALKKMMKNNDYF